MLTSNVKVRERRAAILIYLAPDIFLASARGNTIQEVTITHYRTLNSVMGPALT